jgi:hypothetical protein
MHIICLEPLELKVFVHFLSRGKMSGDGWWEGDTDFAAVARYGLDVFRHNWGGYMYGIDGNIK